MSQNLKLNPEKRDYVFENGSPVPSDSVLEKTYFAIMIPQGKYLYEGKGQGSLVHTLQNTKRTSSIEQQFSTYAKQAVETQLIAKGEATNVEVTNLEATNDGTSNQVQVTPSTKQLSTEFNFVSV